MADRLMATLASWLDLAPELQQEYAKKLLEFGCDSPELLTELTPADFAELGFKTLHARRIVNLARSTFSIGTVSNGAAAEGSDYTDVPSPSSPVSMAVLTERLADMKTAYELLVRSGLTSQAAATQLEMDELNQQLQREKLRTRLDLSNEQLGKGQHPVFARDEATCKRSPQRGCLSILTSPRK